MSDDPRASTATIRFLRAALGTVLSQGKQGALCLTVGGAATLVGAFRGLDNGKLCLVFFSGMALTVLAARYVYSADRQAKALEKKWRRMVSRGKLSQDALDARLRELETQRHRLEMEEAFGVTAPAEPKGDAETKDEDEGGSSAR